jgi:hypothetical protein
LSRRKSGKTGSASPIIGIILLVALAGLAWFAWQRQRTPTLATKPVASTQNPKPTITVAADHLDPANEGRSLNISGVVRGAHPARDPQLAVSGGSDAIALLRRVEMLQWREQCTGASCDYALAWSEQPIDSSAFRQRKGHENVTRFPFTSARFVAEDLRIGAYRLDGALATQLIDASAPVALPVRTSQLPPNLAATFHERDGLLYAGSGEPAAGDLRVGYRVVAGGGQHLIAVQTGDRLKPVPSSAK